MVALWFWICSNIPSGVKRAKMETAAPNRYGIVATAEYPAARAIGALLMMTSFSVTPQQYLPNPSGTVSASSMKWTVPLGRPVVPEV